MRAAKEIKRGELIFIDKPAIEDVSTTKWEANKETEIKLFMKKIDNLPSEAKKQFYLLNGYDDKSFTDMQSSDGEIDATMEVFFRNSRIVNQEFMIFSLYLNMALLNHSCAPNADSGNLLEMDAAGKVHNRKEIRAMKDISKGEEITYCYFGDINNFCCSRQRRKMYMKNNFHLECNCDVCSGLNMDQENIASELFDLLQKLPAPDHYRKGLSEWARDAEKLDRINDLIQEFKLGNLEVKWGVMISLAKTAQLARNKVLVSKGLNMLKSFCDDVQIEKIVLVYEKLEKDLSQWSKNLKSRKTPRRNEIEFFLVKNLLSEIKLSTTQSIEEG